MSAQLKSFEGPDVQVLLDRIRVELGPSAKIDGAEKIRVGGVLGFFAKEHYRVVVEVPDQTAAHADPVASPGVNGHASSPGGRRAGPLEPPARAPDVFSIMAEATDDVNDFGTPPVRSPVPAAGRSTPPAVARATAAPGATPASVAGSRPESFDAVLTRVATTLEAAPGHDGGTAAHPGTGPDTITGGDTGGDGGPGPAGAAFSSPPADVAAGAAQYLAGTAAEGRASTVPVGPTTVGATAAPDDTVVSALRRVGLDDHTVLTVSEGLRRGAGLESLLLEALGTLTPAPALPGQPGSLLVVVGAGTPARRLAASLAGEIGIDPTDVPFASLDSGAFALATGSLLVRTAEDAAERAPGWRRSRACVVVVDAAVCGSERSWARHLIASLRPTAVWGIVDSTTKTDDITTWVETLGGVDALALENTGATTSPAAVLGVGIPVARLDGQPATASRWVATIVDRMIPCT